MGGPGSGRRPGGGSGGGTTRAGYQKGSQGGTRVTVNSKNIHKFAANGVKVKLGQKIKFKHSK